MAMEYYDSINNMDVYVYYLNKNKKLLVNDEVIEVLDKINTNNESNLKSILFEDKNNFKINEKIVVDQEYDLDSVDLDKISFENKSTRSQTTTFKKNENVS
jgi:hypothetical protein